jgi:hypothetical protein
MAITNILEPFGIFYGIWYTSGMLYQEKIWQPRFRIPLFEWSFQV